MENVTQDTVNQEVLNSLTALGLEHSYGTTEGYIVITAYVLSELEAESFEDFIVILEMLPKNSSALRQHIEKLTGEKGEKPKSLADKYLAKREAANA